MKIFSSKISAPCEARTHDLQIMRLTRCLTAPTRPVWVAASQFIHMLHPFIHMLHPSMSIHTKARKEKKCC